MPNMWDRGGLAGFPDSGEAQPTLAAQAPPQAQQTISSTQDPGQPPGLAGLQSQQQPLGQDQRYGQLQTLLQQLLQQLQQPNAGASGPNPFNGVK